MLEEYAPRKRTIPAVVRHLYTLLVVCVGFVIFRADTMSQALHMIGQMFAGWRFEGSASALALSQLTPLFVVVLLAAVIGSMPLGGRVRQLCAKAGLKPAALTAGSYVGAVVLLVLCMASLAGGTYNPFIYFRF